MINAAEPVDVEAIQLFYNTFSEYGLALNVIVPTYGLAEHTVFVCSGGKTILTLNKQAFENGVVDVVTEELFAIHPLASGDADAFHDSDTNRIGNILSHNTQLTQRLVGCGFYKNAENVCIVIVNPNTLEICVNVETNQELNKHLHRSKENATAETEKNVVNIGEIWIDSPSKAGGYWNQTDLSNECFNAKLISKDR